MNDKRSSLEKKFIGCVIGSVIGDTLGARFEGQPYANFPVEYLHSLINQTSLSLGRYTDDSQMMKGILESLIKNNGFDGEDLAHTFVTNFEISRGYGMGTILVLDSIRKGANWNEVAKYSFNGQGSFGNGAAMRVCPVGLLYYYNFELLTKFVYNSAIITHRHPQGIEGAILQAQMVGLIVNREKKVIDPYQIIEILISFNRSKPYKEKLEIVKEFLISNASDIDVIEKLGNKITALESVPTAIYLFLKNYETGFKQTMVNAIKLGGDTDTIASMTGAIAGAYFGIDKIPKNWIKTVEEKDIFLNLSKQLFSLSELLKDV